MKKIFGLTIAALLVIGMVSGGTWAYFSDTESSTNNTLTAGTLDLNINGGNTAVTTFNATNVKPGDSGSGNATLKNVGSISGYVSVTSSAATNTGGSGGTEYEDGVGDLGGVAQMAMFIDVNKNGTFDAGTDYGLKSDGTIYTTGSLQYDTINAYASKNWYNIQTLTANADNKFQVHWQVATSAGNNIQGDQVKMDFTFVLSQNTLP
jgi:spore coat-associated protein N